MQGILGQQSWVQKNFLGRIYLIRGAEEVPVSEISGHLKSISGARALTLKFQFQSKTEDRLHVQIIQTTPGLQYFLNTADSYLTLVPSPQAEQTWALEPLEVGTKWIRCRVFDSRGHQIKVDAQGYLNTERGESHEYLIKRFNPLV